MFSMQILDLIFVLKIGIHAIFLKDFPIDKFHKIISLGLKITIQNCSNFFCFYYIFLIVHYTSFPLKIVFQLQLILKLINKKQYR